MPRAAAIPAAERRAHAVRALLDLARHTAPDQISTAAIAERMGVSHAALFRHFSTRQALWDEAVQWAIRELEGSFEAIAAEGRKDPLSEAEALLLAHASLVEAHPGLLRMLFAELQRPETSPAREAGKAFMQRFRRRLTTLIATAGTAGRLGWEGEAEHLATLVVALHQGLMLQALVHDELGSLPRRSREAVAVLFGAPGPQGCPGGAPAAAPAE